MLASLLEYLGGVAWKNIRKFGFPVQTSPFLYFIVDICSKKQALETKPLTNLTGLQFTGVCILFQLRPWALTCSAVSNEVTHFSNLGSPEVRQSWLHSQETGYILVQGITSLLCLSSVLSVFSGVISSLHSLINGSTPITSKYPCVLRKQQVVHQSLCTPGL